MSRQNLQSEINSLRQVTVKEWFKQAYFRKEKQIEYSLISEELQSIHSLIQGQLSSQEEFISSNLQDPDDAQEYTPRFLTTHQSRQTDHSPFSSTLKSLGGIKSLLHQLFENERVIFSKLPSYPDPGFDGNLSEKLEKEREKLNKLTKKYNDLSMDFLKMNETLKDLRVQREQGCENCSIMRERIEELEEMAEGSPNKEIQRVKQMYEELKQAHDQITDELSAQPRSEYEELDLEKENFMRQVTYLQETQKKLELTNAELMRKLESESRQVNKLHEYIEDYEEEVRKKSAALEKGQGIIKKLNIECEKLAKDLERVENENESLKKENRLLCKTKAGVDKKRSELETMKKTEERLREEISALKNKLGSVLDQHDVQINHLNCLLAQQSQEKNNLEITLEELEQKLSEIELINRKRIEEFNQSCVKIQELEEILKKKDENLQKVNEDIERIITNKDQEFQHLKRQAENMIRHLNSSQTTAKPTKVERKVNEISQTGLAEQLQEALVREGKLKNLIGDLINTEGKSLKEALNNFNKNTAACRAETERWIMRNEELEQRLTDSVEKNLKFIGMIKDLQKMINFKNQQFDEYVKNAESNSNELAAKNDFLQLELLNTYNLISRELLPNSQKVVNQSLSLGHEKLHCLRQEMAKLQERIVTDEEEIQRQLRVMKDMEEEKESISKLLYRANASIIFIEKHLGEVYPCNISPSLSIFPEIDSSHEVTEKGKYIAERLIILKENERQYKDRINQYELDFMQMQKKISDQGELYLLLEKSYEKGQDENRYLTEIAYKEKEEKIKLKTILNEVADNEEKINSLTDYINQITMEKTSLEENYYLVKTELEKAQAMMQAQCRKVEDTEEACFLLRTELEKTQNLLGARFKKFEGNEENLYILKSELEKSQNMLEIKTRKFEDLRENNLREINCLKSKLESVMNETSQSNQPDTIESLRKKKESDKRNFQKRVKEFELVLRYIEDKINALINRNYDPRVEKMQVFIEELKKKNPNLTSWLRVLVANLEKLAQFGST